MKSKEDSHLLLSQIFFGSLVILSCFIVFIFFAENITSIHLNEKWVSFGLMGDYVGGFFGTVINIVALIFLALTFITQRQALVDQKKASRIDLIYSRFFELLKIHRDNANDVTVASEKGRKTFENLVKEYLEIYEIVNYVLVDGGFYSSHRLFPENQFDYKEIREISYCIFYYGIYDDPEGNKILYDPLSKYDIEVVDKIIRSVLGEIPMLSKAKTEVLASCNGHQSQLGHYFRNLYQTVDFIHRQSDISDKEKTELVKSLRAQLTTYEQALLFLNSCTLMGEAWRINEDKVDYLLVYKMVSNIPNGFFGNKFNIVNEFEYGYFEHQRRGKSNK